MYDFTTELVAQRQAEIRTGVQAARQVRRLRNPRGPLPSWVTARFVRGLALDQH